MEEEVEVEAEERRLQPQPHQLHPMEACGAYHPQSLMGRVPMQTTSGHSLGDTKWPTATTTP